MTTKLMLNSKLHTDLSVHPSYCYFIYETGLGHPSKRASLLISTPVDASVQNYSYALYFLKPE